MLASGTSDQSSSSSSFSRQSFNSDETVHHWRLWEQLNLRRISEMGAARVIVAVLVAIHNLKQNTNTSHWLQALVASLGKDSCVFSRTHQYWGSSASFSTSPLYSGDLFCLQISTLNSMIHRFTQYNWRLHFNQRTIRYNFWRLSSRIWVHNLVNQRKFGLISINEVETLILSHDWNTFVNRQLLQLTYFVFCCIQLSNFDSQTSQKMIWDIKPCTMYWWRS